MAEASSLARPYAKAVFEIAQQQGDFDAWSTRLQALAQVTDNTMVQQAIAAPSVDEQQLVDAILAAAGSEDTQTRNLVALMAENNRLTAMTELAEQYQALRFEAQKVTKAEVVSAAPLSDAQRDAIAARLKAKLGTEVTLSTSVDESMIGGAIIRAGDMVIDGSVRAKLERLASSLTH